MNLVLSFQSCHENERQSLLSFKKSVTDASNRLSTWTEYDCCKWNGVGCDNKTGQVTKLDLRNPFPNDALACLTLFEDIVVGGTDTTSTTLEWAITELMHRPDIMRKVQAELEKVVGMNDMVQDSHLPRLRYLDAVLKETLRLHPALPLLVPHSPSLSCAVGGYTIPKGARVFFNVWAIQRDPGAWENPLMVLPERFLNDNNKCDYRGNDFHFLPFRSGRRICAGIPLAERMLIYVLASLLHSFDWTLPEGAQLDFA